VVALRTTARSRDMPDFVMGLPGQYLTLANTLTLAPGISTSSFWGV
jgi:hypothetical protein